jgi:hypothetical protein
MRSCRRDDLAASDQCPKRLIAGRSAGGHDVGDWPTAQRDAHVLASAHAAQYLAERCLELANPNLIHVVTISLTRPHPRCFIDVSSCREFDPDAAAEIAVAHFGGVPTLRVLPR